MLRMLGSQIQKNSEKEAQITSGSVRQPAAELFVGAYDRELELVK